MGTKITASLNKCSDCGCSPKMIQYICVIYYVFLRALVQKSSTRLSCTNREADFSYLTNKFLWHIIYLTRQPIGRSRLPVPANYNNFSKSPIRPRSRAAYLFFRFRIATTSKAKVSIICISSYVLISIPLSARLGTGA